MGSAWMTAGDGGHYIQKVAERYKISDKSQAIDCF
jgi:hypothetical protein